MGFLVVQEARNPDAALPLRLVPLDLPGLGQFIEESFAIDVVRGHEEHLDLLGPVLKPAHAIG